MEMSQIEVLLGRTRVARDPTRSLLASIHRGDAFTKAFSAVLMILVWVLGLTNAIAWIGSWDHVYYEFERWELVLAFVDQFFLLGLLCVGLRVTYLRAGHLRRIPPGYFVSLRAVALILRWLGECVLIVTIGVLGHALLRVPESGWLSLIFGGTTAGGDLKAGLKAWSLLTNSWFQILGFVAFTLFYSLANTIDAFLSIERNTRASKHSSAESNEVAGRGREYQTNREGATVSI